MKISLSDIEPNVGQIDGLPANPRTIPRDKLRKLVNSIREDPEMLSLRGLLVYPYQGKYVTIGGNARLQALQMCGYDSVECVVIPKDTPIGKVKNYIIKDNASFGNWDIEALMRDWNAIDLENWDIDVPEYKPKISFEDEEKKTAGIFQSEREEARSDLKQCIQLHTNGEITYISFFKRSKDGDTLTDIKVNRNNVETFAAEAVNIIRQMGINHYSGWCLITTPMRRHKDWNFADNVCQEISTRLGITYHRDVIKAQSKHRIDAEFEVNYPIGEQNIIIFDDIVTTGSTLKAVKRLLGHKNTLLIAAIHNA